MKRTDLIFLTAIFSAAIVGLALPLEGGPRAPVQAATMGAVLVALVAADRLRQRRIEARATTEVVDGWQRTTIRNRDGVEVQVRKVAD